MAAAHQIASHLLASAAEVPRSLEADARHRHELQLPGQQQPRKQLGVLAIALDPIARRPWCLARRDHVQAQMRRIGGTVEREAGRSGLVTRTQRRRQRLQPSDHLLAAAAEAGAPELATADIDRCGVS